MRLADIVFRIGHEFVKEAEDYPKDRSVDFIRGVMDHRIECKKLFAKGRTISTARAPKSTLHETVTRDQK